MVKAKKDVVIETAETILEKKEADKVSKKEVKKVEKKVVGTTGLSQYEDGEV